MSLTSIFMGAAWLAAAAAATAAPRQPDVVVSFTGGRVTVVAADASAAEILAKWAQVGNTEMSGLDRLSGRHLTLALQEVDESSAIDEIVGPGYGFAASLKTVQDGAVSRFSRLIIVASTPPPPADGHQLRREDPESIYEYSQPRKAGPPSVNGDLAAGLARTTDLPPGTPPSEPERTFDYFTPRRVQEALSRPQPAVIVPDPAVPAPVFIDPELKYQYYVPRQAAPKPVAPPKKPGQP